MVLPFQALSKFYQNFVKIVSYHNSKFYEVIIVQFSKAVTACVANLLNVTSVARLTKCHRFMNVRTSVTYEPIVNL